MFKKEGRVDRLKTQSVSDSVSSILNRSGDGGEFLCRWI